jgi:lipid-A-disaccharide synthase
VKTFPGLWERLLCLLPFEPEFFGRHGLPARFVGHPVLQSGADTGDAARFRARHALPQDAVIVVLMPGSRRTEAPRLMPVFGRAMARLQIDIPALVPVIPSSPVVAEVVARAAARWKVKPLIVTDIEDKHDAYAAAGAALTKSGTSTLELALAGVPMAVTYRVNPITAALARRLIRVKYVAMVNLLGGREIVPELLQQDCTPEKLAEVLRRLLTDTAAAEAQRTSFSSVLASLRAPEGDPATAAARAVLELLDQT